MVIKDKSTNMNENVLRCFEDNVKKSRINQDLYDTNTCFFDTFQLCKTLRAAFYYFLHKVSSPFKGVNKSVDTINTN